MSSDPFDWEWELEIEYNPVELGPDPYEIYFFIDSIPTSPSDWRSSPARLFEPISSNAQGETKLFRLLNGYLQRRGEGKLRDDDVVPYLRKHLVWGIRKRSYEDIIIENSKVKSLKVSVLAPQGAVVLGNEISAG